MRFRRRVNSSQHPSASPSMVSGVLLGVHAHYLSLFLVDVQSNSLCKIAWPVRFARDGYEWVMTITTSRSSKFATKVDWIPRGWFDVVSRLTQSIAIRNIIGERTQPFLTIDLTGNYSVRVSFRATLHSKCSRKFPYGGNNFGWYSICPEDIP